LPEDSLVNVQSSVETDDVVMISSTGYASRFKCESIRASGRVSGGVYGIRVAGRKGSGGGHVVGMLAMSDHDSQILTISKYGMAKRSRLGTADKIPDLDKDGKERFDDDGQLRMMTDGYRSTNPGAKGVRTMKLDEEFEDELISVRRIPDLEDNLFVLTKKGMMIRLAVNQTKETSGKSTRGTRIMELRSKDKSSFLDEIIFTARLPAELVEEDEFDAMDTDGDGVVSREEFEAAQATKDEFTTEEE
jgi:DNA gyrase subunit A